MSDDDQRKEHSSPKSDDSSPAVVSPIQILRERWIEEKVLQKRICRICLLYPLQKSLKKSKKKSNLLRMRIVYRR